MRRVLLAAAVLAGVAAAALLLLDRGRGSRAPRPPLAPLAGDAPEPAGPDVWRLGFGTTRVTVERPTLVETPVGVVELDPGRYEIEGGAGGLRVTVFRGRAVLRDAERRIEVAEGSTGTLAAAAAAPGRPVEARAETGTATVTGQVRDRAGAPVPGARIVVTRAASVLATAVAGDDGRYAVEVSGSVAWVGAEAARLAPSDLRRIEPAERMTYEMDFDLCHRGGLLLVEVRGPGGEAVADAVVLVGGAWRDLPRRETSEEGYPLTGPGPRRLVTDGAGDASADGLPPEWNPVKVHARGFAPYEGHVRLPPDVRVRHTVTLRHGVAVTGTVRDGAAPAASVEVRARNPATGRLYEGLGTVTDADGAFRLENVPAGRVEIVATAADGREAAGWVDLVAGREGRWEGTLGPAVQLAGVVVYVDDGAPAGGATVRCVPVFGRGDRRSTRTDDAGRFAFDDVPDTLHEVTVWAAAYGGLPAELRLGAPAASVRVRPGEGAQAIRIERPVAEGNGALRFQVAGAVDGAPVRASVWPSAAPDRKITAHNEAAIFYLSLDAGTFDLEIHVDGKPTLHVRGVEVRAGETRDLGTLRFPEPAKIRVRVVGADGAPPDALHVRVGSLPPGVFYTVNHLDDGDEAWTEDLAPGRYLVYPGAPGQVVETELAEGETKVLDLRLKPERDVTLRFVLEDGSVPREVGYRIADAAGHPVADGTLTPGEAERRLRLVDGTYTLTATDDRGRTANSTLLVAGPTTATLTLR